MSRKLASVVEIESCEPIPETERLSVVKMVGKGWQVVVGRDEFKKGDLCVYFEIDSYLDSKDERFAFLKDRCLRKIVSKSGTVLREGYKIKTIKLRGVVSQGLVMPVSAFPEIEDPEVGDDVTLLLKVEHFDEVLEQLRPLTGAVMSGDAMGPFPALIPKTDEERIQNLGDWFQTMKGSEWQVTQKHDGTSCTIAYSPTTDPKNPVIVCSRNQRLKPVSETGIVSVYWQMSMKYKIIEKLKKLYDDSDGDVELALQGEIVGPGINGNRNHENEYKFLVFRAWRVPEQRFYQPEHLILLCDYLVIPHVNVVEDRFKFFDEITTMEDALKFAEGKTPEGNEREGLVCKSVDRNPLLSFKIVSNKYLLRGND